MKKLIVILLSISMLLMCSCNLNNETVTVTENQNQDAEISLTTESMETVLTEEPYLDVTPRWFKTETEFVDAIKNDPKAIEENTYSVGEMAYYFIPEVIPEGALLDYIAVKDFYVALYYKYDKEPDPFWERTFMFEWYRTKKTGDTELNVRNQFSEERIKQNNEYYIIKIKPTDDYKGNNEYVCQDVYWEKDGYAFHAVVPIWFTEADIEKYCVAKKVVVK